MRSLAARPHADEGLRRMDIAGLPKTELHLHLEGAIAHEILLDLVHKYGDAKIVSNLETLKTSSRLTTWVSSVIPWR